VLKRNGKDQKGFKVPWIEKKTTEVLHRRCLISADVNNIWPVVGSSNSHFIEGLNTTETGKIWKRGTYIVNCRGHVGRKGLGQDDLDDRLK
jgi:hypothetical protein